MFIPWYSTIDYPGARKWSLRVSQGGGGVLYRRSAPIMYPFLVFLGKWVEQTRHILPGTRSSSCDAARLVRSTRRYRHLTKRKWDGAKLWIYACLLIDRCKELRILNSTISVISSLSDVMLFSICNSWHVLDLMSSLNIYGYFVKYLIKIMLFLAIFIKKFRALNHIFRKNIIRDINLKVLFYFIFFIINKKLITNCQI